MEVDKIFRNLKADTTEMFSGFIVYNPLLFEHLDGVSKASQ